MSQEDLGCLKKTKLVWKSPSHRLEMSTTPRKFEGSNKNRNRSPVFSTSSPVRPGSVPPKPYSSPRSSPIDNNISARHSRSPSSIKRAHFYDGIDTKGRRVESYHECNMSNRDLPPAFDDLQHRLEQTQMEAAQLDENRRELLDRLREAELNGRAAARQVVELQELVKQLRHQNSHNINTTDVAATLSCQKEELAHKLEIFEETNRHLRDLLRTADFESGRMKASDEDRMEMKRQIFQLENDNSRLRKQLVDCEDIRAGIQRQVHSRESDIERLTVQLKSLEKKYGRDSQEIMLNYEQLKKATRGWKQKWQKAEKDVETIQRELDNSDADAASKIKDMQRKIEMLEEDRDKLRRQLDDSLTRLKDHDLMLTASKTGERELTTEVAALDRRLREACSEVEILKQRNCELVNELEVAADREVHSRMSQEQAGREFDVLRERMANRCAELEDLVNRLKCGGVSAQEARDCVLEMRLNRATDELECMRAKHSELVQRMEESQMAYTQTKATNRTLLDYIARLRKSYSDNFGQLAAEACPTLSASCR